MPGLIGIISTQNGKANTENLLTKMCNAIKHEEWYKTDSHTSKSAGLGRVHLGVFNPEPQPIFNEDKSLCIIMDGEIYDYTNLKQELIHKGYTFPIDNDPEFILHLYEEYGNDLVHKLNGSFTFAIWDEKLKKLILINDRYGSRPLYYTEHDGDLLFGSEVKAILQDETFERKVDDRSVADFFSFGFILGNKTFFREIGLLPPASILTYDAGQVSIEQYWNFLYNEKYEDYPEEYYIDTLSKLILQAVERQMKGHHRIGVPLSGGLDSRTIVGSIQQKHYPIYTFTFGKKNCHDGKFAEMMANKLGTVHQFFEFKPEDLVSYTEKTVYLTDGMKNGIHSHIYNIVNGIEQKVDVVFDGIQGIKLGTPDPSLYNAGDDKILSYLLNPLKNIELLFSNSYYFRIEQYLTHYMEDLQKNSSINVSLNRFSYYQLSQKKRRFTFYGPVILRSKVETRFPFYDNDIMDFILAVPPKLRLKEHIYLRSIIKLFPHLSSIPWQKTGLPLTASKLHIRIHSKMEGLKRIFNYIAERTTGIKHVFKDDKNYQDYNNWMRYNKKLREYIYNILLDERTQRRPYFNQGYINGILDQHMNDNKDHSELIGRLLTFELWNRQFIDKK